MCCAVSCACVPPRLLSLLCVLQREVSQSQLLPAIILAPTNAVLKDYLRALQALKADAAAGSNGGGSNAGGDSTNSSSSTRQEAASLQQLVDDFVSNKAASLVLVSRHCEYCICWVAAIDWLDWLASWLYVVGWLVWNGVPLACCDVPCPLVCFPSLLPTSRALCIPRPASSPACAPAPPVGREGQHQQ